MRKILLWTIGTFVLSGFIAGAVWYAKEPPIEVPKEIVNPPRLEVSASPEPEPALTPDSTAGVLQAIDAVIIEGGDKDFEAIDRDVNGL